MNQEELKQRLIELLDSVGHDYDEYVDSCHEDGMSPYESFEEFAAPYLIANGVTIRERGEWKLGKSGCMCFCTHCANFAHQREKDEWRFCPHCGADMRGVTKTEKGGAE